MGSMLDIGSMRERIAAALSFEQSVLKSGIRAEALTPLHYLFTGQMELPRSMFKQLAVGTAGGRLSGQRHSLSERRRRVGGAGSTRPA